MVVIAVLCSLATIITGILEYHVRQSGSHMSIGQVPLWVRTILVDTIRLPDILVLSLGLGPGPESWCTAALPAGQG
jgi:hypothetical protein